MLPGEVVRLSSLPLEDQRAWLSLSAGIVQERATHAFKRPDDLWRLCRKLLSHSCPLMAPGPGVPCGLAIQATGVRSEPPVNSLNVHQSRPPVNSLFWHQSFNG